MTEVLANLFSEAERRGVQSSLAEPLYHQLYVLLRRKIESGEIAHRAQLPSEIELAQLFDVSRITTKRALDELARDNIVERRRGSGTHVKQRFERKILRAPLLAMLESLTVMGQATTVDVLELARIPAPANIAVAMGITAGTPLDHAVRVRRCDGEPFAYYQSYTLVLPQSSQLFNRKALKTQTRLEIFRQLGIKLAEVDQVLGATAATAAVASALELPISAPVMTVERSYIDQDRRIVDYLLGQYRPDRFQYHMRMSATDRRKS